MFESSLGAGVSLRPLVHTVLWNQRLLIGDATGARNEYMPRLILQLNHRIKREASVRFVSQRWIPDVGSGLMDRSQFPVALPSRAFSIQAFARPPRAGL